MIPVLTLSIVLWAACEFAFPALWPLLVPFRAAVVLAAPCLRATLFPSFVSPMFPAIITRSTVLFCVHFIPRRSFAFKFLFARLFFLIVAITLIILVIIALCFFAIALGNGFRIGDHRRLILGRKSGHGTIIGH